MIELNVTNYKGPMDLLLSLIEKNKIDIYDIPIKEITEGYIQIINKIDVNAEEISDFILMASSLIEIKSKMLVPKLNILEDDPREELVEKLLEYKKFKIISSILEELRVEESMSYAKVKEEFEVKTESLNLDEDIRVLSDVFFKLIYSKLNLTENIFFEEQIVKKEVFSVEKYFNTILKKLKSIKKISLKELVSTVTNKQELITSFLAVLELVSSKMVIAYQLNESDIILESRGLNEQ